MNKRYVFIFTVCILSFVLNACGNTVSTSLTDKPIAPGISTSKIRSLSALSTKKVYYNNVAVIEQKAGTGFWHLGEIDRTEWIQYRGWVKLGIDASRIKISIDENNISLSMPPAMVMSSGIDYKSLNEADARIYSDDGMLNKNPISGIAELNSIKEAQTNMIQRIESDSSKILDAQNCAEKLIENYIVMIGKEVGVSYNFTCEVQSESVK